MTFHATGLLLVPGYLVFFITIVTLHEKIVNKMGSIIATVFYVIAMGVLYDDMKRTYHINIPKKLRESMKDNR